MLHLNRIGNLLSNIITRVGTIVLNRPLAAIGVLIYWILQIWLLVVIHEAVGTLVFTTGIVVLNVAIAIWAYTKRTNLV